MSWALDEYTHGKVLFILITVGSTISYSALNWVSSSLRMVTNEFQ